jgi:hypothetical protein
MAITSDIQLKFSTAPGAVPTAADLTFEGVAAAGVPALNAADGRLYTLLADLTTVVCIGAPLGVANGTAPLGADAKVPLANLPAIATTGLRFKGVWNATSGAPDAAPAEGDYYIVTIAGTTNLDGITDWQPTDWAVYSDAAWRKIDNSEAAAPSAISGGTF